MKTLKSLALVLSAIFALQSCTQVDGNATKNKEAFNKIIESFQTGNTDGLDAVVAENFVDHAAMPGMKPGAEGLKEVIAAYRIAFPDLKFEFKNIMAEGDMVMAYGKWTGTNTGESFGMPATGKYVESEFVDIVRFENGKAAEHWETANELRVMQQLGLIPTEEAIAKRTQLTNDFLAAMDANNKDALAALCTTDFKCHHPDYPEALDFEGFFKHVSAINAAFAGAKHIAADIVVSGNKIAARGTVGGKHTGAFGPVKPSNKDVITDWLAQMELNGDDKIVSLHVQYNQVSLLKQVGAMK